MLAGIIDAIATVWGSYHDRKARLAGIVLTIVLGVVLLVWLA